MAQLDPPPARPTMWFAPVVYKVAVAGSLLVGLVAALTSVGAVHAARGAHQEVCAAKLQAWKARNPALVRGLRPHAHACAHLELVVGEIPRVWTTAPGSRPAIRGSRQPEHRTTAPYWTAAGVQLRATLEPRRDGGILERSY